jgi:hypothetical protein
VETLYKEELQELKLFYEELLRGRDSKLESVEGALTSRCRELEAELERARCGNPRGHEIDTELESPFELGDLDGICHSPLHEEST